VLVGYDLAGARRRGRTWARMMSFSAPAVFRMSALCPQLPTVLLIAAPIGSSHLGGALPEGVSTLALDVAVLRQHPEVVANQHGAGHDVYVLTVDADDDIRLCLELGVDAIISNRPGPVLEIAGRPDSPRQPAGLIRRGRDRSSSARRSPLRRWDRRRPGARPGGAPWAPPASAGPA